jgi:hypothetical protein
LTELRPGDIIFIHDDDIARPKTKLHICICPDRRRFLRINSRPLYPPHHPLTQAANPFLDHDSYVELQSLCWHSHPRLIAAMQRKSNPIGRLSAAEISALIVAVSSVPTLTPEQIELIREMLEPFAG